MANKYFRYIKQPLKPEIMHKHIRERVIQELQVVGQAHVYERQQIVQDFKHKPEWGFDVKITQKELRLRILLKNPDAPVSEDWTIADLWQALDEEGTGLYGPRHAKYPITPKRAKALRFRAGRYMPKTNPGGKFRGPGKVQGGQIVFRKQVQHPGTKPRHFTRRINKDLRKLFLTQAERGYRLGHQQALLKHR